MRAWLSLIAACAAPALASDLYRDGNWAAMSADRRASAIGDGLVVLIFQASESSNVAQGASRKRSDVGGRFAAGSIDEPAELSFGGGYSGRGEFRRSERLVAQMSVTIVGLTAGGDYRIGGRQRLRVNGETSLIAVRGRIRPADISADNAILSNRIVDAEIDYDGKGFVSRGAKPGIVNRLFSLLGLG